LLIVAGGLYVMFDPLGMQSSSRDTKRQADIIQMQNALSAYYQAKQQYPQSLSQLVPEFLSTLPQDPKSGTVYSYRAVESDSNYELCVTYELTQAKCLSGESMPAVIPVVPTVTSIPAFVPQSTSSGTLKSHAE